MAGNGSLSRIFSPEFNSSSSAGCLSFFFAMDYEGGANTSLTVYRGGGGVWNEIWRVTSAALERSEVRYNKSPWIPARVPIPSDSSNQVKNN